MNIKKYLKGFSIAMASATLISTVSISAIACGTKKKPPAHVNSWDDFKKLALDETAQNLKNNINDIGKYHWKSGDSATFINDAKPSANETLHTINAIIGISSGTAPDSQLPISCVIKYQSNDIYHITNWKFSQDPNIYQWSSFVTIAKTVTATQLIAQARQSSEWNSFIWDGDATINVWSPSELAEFDTFGGLNNGVDPYKGMNGKPIANYSKLTITAIISIQDKTKEGLYTANPIIATISDASYQDYNLDNWTFTQTSQLQSRAKYTSLFNYWVTEAQNAKDVKPAGSGWDNLYGRMWFDKTHKTNILTHLNGMGKGPRTQTSYINSFPFNTTVKNTLASLIIIDFWASGATQRMSLTTDFILSNGNSNSGTAFNNVWHIQISTQ